MAKEGWAAISLFHQTDGIVLERFDVETFALNGWKTGRFHVFSFHARKSLATELSVLSAVGWKTVKS